MTAETEDLAERLISVLWLIAADVKELKAEIQSLQNANNQMVAYEQAVIDSLSGSSTQTAQAGESGQTQDGQ